MSSGRGGLQVLRRRAQPGAGADDVQRRAARAGVLARRRHELARPGCARSRQTTRPRERPRHPPRRRRSRRSRRAARGSGRRPRPRSRRSRKHASAYTSRWSRYSLVDDLLAASSLRVRSSCSRRRARVRPPSGACRGSRGSARRRARTRTALSVCASSSAGDASRERRGAVGLDEAADQLQLLVRHVRIPAAHAIDVDELRLFEVDRLEQAVHGVADVRARRGPRRRRRSAATARMPDEPFGVVAVRAALERRERGERQPADRLERRLRESARGRAAAARRATARLAGLARRARAAPAPRRAVRQTPSRLARL